MSTYRIIGLLTGIALLAVGCGRSEPPVAPPASVPAKPSPEVEAVVEEPDEETILATRAVKENCLICHSSDIIEAQRLTAKQWKAEVEKMVGWGSPLLSEQQEGVIKYLSSGYDDKKARVAPGVMTLAAAHETIAPEVFPNEANSGDLAKGAASFAINCRNCHGANGEGSPLGPNLVERPVLLRPKDYFEAVNKGRGKMPMLGTIVNKQAGLDILAWLKTKRFTEPFPATQP